MTAAEIARVDVPQAELERRVQARADRLAVILAHPETAIVPARPGHLDEYAHLMHDADPDSTVPLIPNWTPGGVS